MKSFTLVLTAEQIEFVSMALATERVETWRAIARRDERGDDSMPLYEQLVKVQETEEFVNRVWRDGQFA